MNNETNYSNTIAMGNDGNILPNIFRSQYQL